MLRAWGWAISEYRLILTRIESRKVSDSDPSRSETGSGGSTNAGIRALYTFLFNNLFISLLLLYIIIIDSYIEYYYSNYK